MSRITARGAASCLRRGRRGVGPLACSVALLLLAGPWGPAAAQVVQTPEGEVEFIGLKRWTVEMIRDSVEARAPGTPLGACAAVLLELGFPSASSAHFTSPGATRRIVVTVVEPADSARVRLRPLSPDSSADRTEWAAATDMFRSRNRAFQRAVSSYDPRAPHGPERRDPAAADAGDDTAAVAALWDFLRAHRSERDWEDALRVLATDGNIANQAVAASILGNFDERELAWWVLADLQRAPRPAVAATAHQVLQAMARRTTSQVDWEPAVPVLRHLLAGTNVFLFAGTVEVLRQTRISPVTAPSLLDGDTCELLLGHLRAKQPGLRESAHGFLVQLAGTDLGYDSGAWARWIDSLPTAPGAPAGFRNSCATVWATSLSPNPH